MEKLSFLWFLLAENTSRSEQERLLRDHTFGMLRRAVALPNCCFTPVFLKLSSKRVSGFSGFENSKERLRIRLLTTPWTRHSGTE
jgi:hypothetical protein